MLSAKREDKRTASANKIKVLIVDDSAVVRQALKDIFAQDDTIEVVGAAQDPYAAANVMERVTPDVITLDVEMPRMDGLTFLKKLMAQHPLPVVICSTLTGAGSDAMLRALEYGAVEIIEKPKLGTKKFFEESTIRILDVVKAAARAKVRPKPRLKVEPKLSADAMLPGATDKTLASLRATDKVVLVGASTGGTEALRTMLLSMPLDCPAIAVVQHMPETFTAAFAQRLNQDCAITVKEAKNGDAMLRGQALIAPGNRHMLLKSSGARYYVELRDGPLVRRHRPSVDVLFRSGARYAGKNAVGVILTGMGDDGAHGLLELKNTGAYTIAQDEATCVVYGMPGEAVRLGAAHQILPLQRIATEVLRNIKL